MSFAIDNTQPAASASASASAEQQSSSEQESLQQTLSSIDNVLLLPLGKIKKICKSDPDYLLQSNLASVVGGLATQLFIEKFTEDSLLQAHVRDRPGNANVSANANTNMSANASANANTKTRLTYDDLHQSVSKDDKYMFLKDIIPKQKSLHALVRDNKIRYSVLESGQQMLNFQSMNANQEVVLENHQDEDVMEGIEEPLSQDNAVEEVHTDEESNNKEGEDNLVEVVDMDGTTKEDRMIDNENESSEEITAEAENNKKRVELIDFGIDSTTDEES
ncbi:hypothetical protein ACO0QE_004053 [Hanseniaspora vineae]